MQNTEKHQLCNMACETIKAEKKRSGYVDRRKEKQRRHSETRADDSTKSELSYYDDDDDNYSTNQSYFIYNHSTNFLYTSDY